MSKLWLIIPFGFFSFFLLTYCSKDPNADIKDIELDIDFVRVDSLMYEASKALQKNPEQDFMDIYKIHLQSERDFLFSWLYLDQLIPKDQWDQPIVDTAIAKNLGPLLADANIYMLLDSVQKIFPYDYPFKERITPPLKRLKKYISDIQIPAFRTHLDGYVPQGDMRMVDQITFLSGQGDEPGFFSFGLHYFMGTDLEFYPQAIPQFQRNRFSEKYLEVLMVESIANGLLPQITPSQQPTLMDQMVRQGIKQYCMQQLLPNTPDSLRLKYTNEQMYWANFYEAKIYKELMGSFFNTDFVTHRDFLTDKPYTTSLSQESAPRLGEYLGWKIVYNYMDRNRDVSLEELVEMTDYEKIFRESRYKPEAR